MATTLGTQSVSLSGEERTWRLEVFTEKGEDPTVRAHREEIWTKPDGTVVQRNRAIPAVERRLSEVAKASFTAAGQTVTGAELAALLAAAADALRQDDLNARQPEESA